MFSKLPHVSQSPVSVAYTPNSILNLDNHSMPYLSVLNRKRYGTCTDVKWFNNNNYLATLNMATETIHTYEFNSYDHSLTLLQILNNQNGIQLHWPEKFAFSNNGLYLAVANSKENMCSINIYNIDTQTNLINPIPIQVIQHKGAIFHEIQFSPNSQYLVSSTMDDLGLIRIYKLDYDANSDLNVTLTQVVKNHYLPLKPKSIDFSSDGSLMAISYGPNAGSLSPQSYGALAIYVFDNNSGTISTQPLCELNERPELSVPDGISFSHDAMSSFIVVPSQSNDTVIFYSFDKMSNQINPEFFALKNPEAQLSFPHGLSLSSDDKYLAVSNYGDDKVTVYSLERY